MLLPSAGFPGRMVPGCLVTWEHPSCEHCSSRHGGRSTPKNGGRRSIPPFPGSRHSRPTQVWVNHPRERLGACPGCCRQHAFLPGPTQQGWGRAPAGGSGAAGCCRVLPVPAPSKGCAAFRIFSSHCHSNRLGAWVPAMPAPASRIPQPSCPQPSPPGPGHCRYGPARPTQHSVVFGEL